jgi:hypothetical protein
MAPRSNPTPENQKQNIENEELNSLVYSIETKTFLHFMKSLVAANSLKISTSITDPLPNFDFDDISEEITKRAPKLDKQKRNDIKIWIEDIVKRLEQLIEEEMRSFGEKQKDMYKNEVEKKEKELTDKIEEIKKYKTKIETIIGTQKTTSNDEKEQSIQTATQHRFEQLDLFEDNK